VNQPPRRPAFAGPSPTAGRVLDVTEGVQLAIGYHLGSVIRVTTSEGAVTIDSTGARANAVAARDDLQRHSEADTRFLVYTHCHRDHCGGAEPFTSDRTEAVVAQALLPELWHRDTECLGPWHRRVRAWQRGLPGPPDDDAPTDGRLAGMDAGVIDRTYIEPTLTFDDELDIELGGLTFHLEHTEGETRDHLLVWIPELRTLCPGDLYYSAFPNLSTPAIGPRPVQGWIRSLERLVELGAEHLVPSHTLPVSGPDKVRDVLTNYRDAISFVWDESIRAMNEGRSVHEAARTIRLPPHLAGLPYLAERYGTVAWGVRAVYDQLAGWYDGDPAHLDPLPRAHLDRELVTLAGADAMAARAEQLHCQGEDQLALELLSVLIEAEPDNEAANRLQIRTCQSLAAAATSINQVGFYTSGIRAAESRLSAAVAETKARATKAE
jgi:alkyl sulfatase BDS1-like metallo-beta-lactamase superfamily hydrolase